jgi:hypothetical protein
VGQPHFDKKLNSLGLRRLGQKIEIKQEIRPFTEEESRGYIDHRLRSVGSSSEIMTPKAISMICSYAQGISSLINHVCDNALWVGSYMGCKKINVDVIEKVIQNLEGQRILPKAFPSIQPLKRVWKSSAQFAISFKRISTVVFLKVIQNLEILLETLPSIQLIKRIMKFPTQFAISFKKVSMVAYLKVIQNFEILPKALPSIQLVKQIWKSPVQFAISFKEFQGRLS